MLDRLYSKAGADVDLTIHAPDCGQLSGLDFERDRIREALGLLGFDRFNLHLEQGGVQPIGAPFALKPLKRRVQLKPDASDWCAQFVPASAQRFTGDLEVLWNTEDTAGSMDARLRQALFHTLDRTVGAQRDLYGSKFWLFFAVGCAPAAFGCYELLPFTHGAAQFFYTLSEQSARLICDGVRVPSWFSPADVALDHAVRAHGLLQQPLVRAGESS